MDYKKMICRLYTVLGVIIFSPGCNDAGKDKTKGVNYYVEIMNGPDSVKNALSERIFGKVSYYDSSHLTLVSKNFLTDDFPAYHAYEPVSSLPKDMQRGMKKVTVEFAGNFLVDSTYYAVRMFSYSKDKWSKVSDIGFIKAEPRYNEPLKTTMPLKDLVNAVTLAIMETTYSR